MRLKVIFQEYVSIPKVNSGFMKVWARNFLHFKKAWMASFVWVVLEPLMYLGGIGYGLGAFVNNMAGMSFLEFFFPGLLCTTAMYAAFFEGTYANYSKLTYQKIYQSIMMTRIGPEEIVFGEILWGATKGFIGVCGVTLIAMFFGLVDTIHIVPALLVLFVIAWLFSSIAMIVTSFAKNYDSFIYSTSGFIIPMTLLAGVYYPIHELPSFVTALTYLLPLTHAVEAVRTLLVKGFTEMFWVHFAVLIITSWICMNIAIYRIRSRLLR